MTRNRHARRKVEDVLVPVEDTVIDYDMNHQGGAAQKAQDDAYYRVRLHLSSFASGLECHVVMTFNGGNWRVHSIYILIGGSSFLGSENMGGWCARPAHVHYMDWVGVDIPSPDVVHQSLMSSSPPGGYAYTFTSHPNGDVEAGHPAYRFSASVTSVALEFRQLSGKLRFLSLMIRCRAAWFGPRYMATIDPATCLSLNLEPDTLASYSSRAVEHNFVIHTCTAIDLVQVWGKLSVTHRKVYTASAYMTREVVN
ncbi:hypothetical protein EDC04DRAFT_3093287 [Pisolithus marmoratus]|nr:hypothetical protein EDC04DRAFT_3093287 [Pisolithus marmoratus]